MQEEIFDPILPSLLRSGSFQATQHIWDPIVVHVSKHENGADVFLGRMPDDCGFLTSLIL